MAVRRCMCLIVLIILLLRLLQPTIWLSKAPLLHQYFEGSSLLKLKSCPPIIISLF